MLASELAAQLNAMIAQHGDHEVVSGVNRTGYGEAVEDVAHEDGPKLLDIDGQPTQVFDLLLSDDSTVSVGGF